MNFSIGMFHSGSNACGHDPVSSLTHLVGAVWFLCLAKPLLLKADRRKGQALALGIYAFSCVFLLFVSGLYHWLPPGFARDFMRRMDLVAIFLLIAGTYTPICALLYRGVTRWGSLGIIWMIALMGILLRTVSVDSLPGSLGTAVYLGFGWLGAILAVDLWYRRSFAFVKPLLWGGLAYTGGVAILEMGLPSRMPPGITAHDLWHMAVLMGIAWHWQFVTQLAAHPVPSGAIQSPAKLAPGFQSTYDPAQT